MNAATGDDLKKACLLAEQRCTTHPYGSKAASLILFELSRNVQSKVEAGRSKADVRAMELSKLREFRAEWESYFGNHSQGEMGVVPMTPAAAAGTIRAQGASIKELECDLAREREQNKQAQATLATILQTHQESSRRAAKLESERIHRQIEALARRHEAELQHERSLRAQALRASRGLAGDNAATAEGADELRRQLASSVAEAQQLRAKVAQLESVLRGAVAQAQVECEALLKSRERHWRHQFSTLQAQGRAHPEVAQLRERERDLAQELAALEGRYKAEVGALKRRTLEQGRLNNVLRRALAEQTR